MAELVVKNLKETMLLLKKFEPEQSKLIAKRITKAAGKIAVDARSDIPEGSALTNWGSWIHARDGRDFGFNTSSIRKNIKVTRAANRKRGVAISNYIGITSADAAGVIYQTAGKGTSDSNFVSKMMGGYPLPRGIWKAFDESRGTVVADIDAAVREAEEAVQRHLNELGGG